MTVQQVRDLAREARDLEHRKLDLEAQLTSINKQLNTLYFQKIPDAMDEAGVDTLGIPPEGNLPGYDLEIKPFISANIGAKWPPDKRAAALKWLDENGHGDLIKTEVLAAFPREDRDEARKFLETVRASDPDARVEVKESVNHMTLSAWLRDLFSTGQPIPPLEVIGGTIARMANLKPRGERNGA
jgi:hypothetical protein